MPLDDRERKTIRIMRKINHKRSTSDAEPWKIRMGKKTVRDGELLARVGEG